MAQQHFFSLWKHSGHIGKDLGTPIAADMTVGPTTKLVFLGILFDTTTMTMAWPSNKLDKLLQVTKSFLSVKKLTFKELQSLIGLLNFACRVVAPGRAFCRRFINATVGISKPHYRVRLTKNIKQDLNFIVIQWCFCYQNIFLDSQTYNFSQIARGVAMGDSVCLLGVNGHMGPDLSCCLLRVHQRHESAQNISSYGSFNRGISFYNHKTILSHW